MITLKQGLGNGPIRLAVMFIVGLWLPFAPPSPAPFAQSLSPQRPADSPKPVLDGLKFIGPFGAEGEKAPKDDIFTFKDGKFSTASCLQWGFTPGPYWTRSDPKGIRFLAELESPDHGTMRYEGLFDGKVLNVVGYWKKERWYWTIERTYRGKGRLAGPAG